MFEKLAEDIENKANEKLAEMDMEKLALNLKLDSFKQPAGSALNRLSGYLSLNPKAFDSKSNIAGRLKDLSRRIANRGEPETAKYMEGLASQARAMRWDNPNTKRTEAIMEGLHDMKNDVSSAVKKIGPNESTRGKAYRATAAATPIIAGAAHMSEIGDLVAANPHTPSLIQMLSSMFQ